MLCPHVMDAPGRAICDANTDNCEARRQAAFGATTAADCLPSGCLQHRLHSDRRHVRDMAPARPVAPGMGKAEGASGPVDRSSRPKRVRSPSCRGPVSGSRPCGARGPRPMARPSALYKHLCVNGLTPRPTSIQNSEHRTPKVAPPLQLAPPSRQYRQPAANRQTRPDREQPVEAPQLGPEWVELCADCALSVAFAHSPVARFWYWRWQRNGCHAVPNGFVA
jgi:hypothetical protein